MPSPTARSVLARPSGPRVHVGDGDFERADQGRSLSPLAKGVDHAARRLERSAACAVFQTCKSLSAITSSNTDPTPHRALEHVPCSDKWTELDASSLLIQTENDNPQC